MKQVTQRLRDGRIEVLDVPVPELQPHGVLVDIRASLLSAGTERTKVITGRQSLVRKARSRPDQVRQVIDKARREGFRQTVEAVRIRLDQPGGLGYSAAGVVLAAGSRVTDLVAGDRVACAGSEYALHAEVDYVPGNLCVRLPQSVSFEQGAFTTIGSIAMHGVHQADVHIGERVAVIGLGLVGQLACRILRAAGCTVVGVDLANSLIDEARAEGVIDYGFPRTALTRESLPAEASDCDAVIITAATKSADPIELAALLARDRARVVAVGDVGMTVPRAPYYEKELELRLSRSYGPGRYDREYEERGLDYPIGYVRWTERRNMAAFVALLAAGRVDVDSLVRERVPIDQAPAAYERLATSDSSTLGIVLQYEPTPAPARRRVASSSAAASSPLSCGVIGAGIFAQRVLIPSLRAAGFSMETIASRTGLSASAAAERFGFRRVDSVDAVLDDPAIGLVVVATRHSTHAEFSARALRAGKDVFVEKPPCLSVEELATLRIARAESGRALVVGFNRRHAPLAKRMREHIAGRNAPIELLVRVNAGKLDERHWLNDLSDGGGRLLGEGCHFTDFACWMIGALPDRISCVASATLGVPLMGAQQFVVTMSFPGGSIGTVIYGTGAATGVGKEYIEAHSDGHTAVLDDFRSLTLVDGRQTKHTRGRGRDKGHGSQARYLRQVVQGDIPETGTVDMLESMAVTLAALRALEVGAIVSPACD